MTNVMMWMGPTFLSFYCSLVLNFFADLVHTWKAFLLVKKMFQCYYNDERCLLEGGEIFFSEWKQILSYMFSPNENQNITEWGCFEIQIQMNVKCKM